MMTNLMTILERKVFISSNPRIVLSSCPPPCGHFSIQESATGGLSYKGTKARLAQLQMSLPDLIKKSTLTEETCCDILAGKTVPGIDATASLSKALDTSMDYLVGNSDYSCAIASEDEQDIILLYRQLSKKGKRIFLGMMEKMEEEKTE